MTPSSLKSVSHKINRDKININKTAQLTFLIGIIIIIISKTFISHEKCK